MPSDAQGNAAERIRAGAELLATAEEELMRRVDPARTYGRAVEEYQEALKHDPTSREARRGLAAALLKRADADETLQRDVPERWDAAIAALTEALMNEAGDSPLLLDRSHAWSMKGQCEARHERDPDVSCRRAIDDAETALRADPSAAIAYVRRADANLVLAEWKTGARKDARAECVRALADYDEAIRRGCATVEVYLHRAMTHQTNGMALEVVSKQSIPCYDRAIADFTEAIRLKPDRVPTYGERAGALMCKARAILLHGGDPLPVWEAAIRDLGATIARSQGDPQAHLFRAKARMDIAQCMSAPDLNPLPHILEALSDCGEALSLNPDYLMALELRAFLFKLKGDLEVRMEAEHEGSYGLALRDCRNAEARGSISWLVYVAHGDASAALGDKRDAVRAYRWLIKHAQLAPETRLEIEGRIRALLDGEDRDS